MPLCACDRRGRAPNRSCDPLSACARAAGSTSYSERDRASTTHPPIHTHAITTATNRAPHPTAPTKAFDQHCSCRSRSVDPLHEPPHVTSERVMVSMPVYCGGTTSVENDRAVTPRYVVTGAPRGRVTPSNDRIICQRPRQPTRAHHQSTCPTRTTTT